MSVVEGTADQTTAAMWDTSDEDSQDVSDEDYSDMESDGSEPDMSTTEGVLSSPAFRSGVSPSVISPNWKIK